MYPSLPEAFLEIHQNIQPGHEHMMNPRPIYDNENYIGSAKLKDRVAIITGGDSGIGRAVAVAFAKEGAAVTLVYLNEQEDADETKAACEKYGGRCLLYAGDLRDESLSQKVVDRTLECFSGVDILINNCAVQYPQHSLVDISKEQLYSTFETNIFSYFYMTKAVLPHLKENDCIVNTASVTAYKGNEKLIDYSSTKGAIVSFTRSLSLSLEKQKIRVNAVAPGPIWTPLIVSSFSAQEVSQFGKDTKMSRAGQPFELAPSYVYLCSDDAMYVSGQVLHVNGGVITCS